MSKIKGDWQALRSSLRWGSLDDGTTRATVRDLDARGYLANPHSAVACAVLERTLRSGETGASSPPPIPPSSKRLWSRCSAGRSRCRER